MVMAAKRIQDFVLEDRIEGFFAVRRKEVREYSRGQFVSLELGDSSGRIPAVIWEPDQFALRELCEGTVVKVRGVIGEYQNRLQLGINRIRLADKEEYKLEDVLAHSAQSLEERRARIMALTAQIENPNIKHLAEEFFELKNESKNA